MKYSNLAERLEEFAAAVSVIDQPEPQADRHEFSPACRALRGRHRGASSRTARRIQIRDQGLRPFRVS